MIPRSRFSAAVIIPLLLLGKLEAAVIVDPPGDTFVPSPLDITWTEGVSGPFGSQISIGFAGPITPPSAHQANSVFGFIDIDYGSGPADSVPWGGAPLVGGNNWVNFFVPPNPGTPAISGPLVGVDTILYIDFQQFQQTGAFGAITIGTVPLIETSPQQLRVTRGDVIFYESSLTVFFQVANLSSGGKYDVLITDAVSPVDRAPNGEIGLSFSLGNLKNPVLPVPEANSVICWLLIGCCSALRPIRSYLSRR